MKVAHKRLQLPFWLKLRTKTTTINPISEIRGLAHESAAKVAVGQIEKLDPFLARPGWPGSLLPTLEMPGFELWTFGLEMLYAIDGGLPIISITQGPECF